MCDQWRLDEDMGHGVAVPFVALWIAWRERGRLRDIHAEPSAWGLMLLAAGAAFHLISAIGAGLFAGSVGLLLSTAGIVLALGGFRWLRAWFFPLLLLVFMLPKLAVLYNTVTLPLQLTATRLAQAILWSAGFAAGRQGNILTAGNVQVAVAEACSGVRYLLPLAFAGVVFAYVTDAKPWMRWVMLVLAVPLAIVANALRVALALLSDMASPRLGGEPYHSLLGWLSFVLCLAAMYLCERMVNRIYVSLRA